MMVPENIHLLKHLIFSGILQDTLNPFTNLTANVRVMKSIKFLPPKYLRNPHLQSIMNSLGPRKVKAKLLLKRFRSKTMMLRAADGTYLLGEFDKSNYSQNAIVVLLHGWEGSSKSSYLVTTANMLLNHGFDVLRLNFRDHGNTHHMNRGIFNSTMSPSSFPMRHLARGEVTASLLSLRSASSSPTI